MNYYLINRDNFKARYNFDLDICVIGYETSVSVTKSEGIPVISIKRDSSVKNLNSKYSAVSEAEKWVSEIKKPSDIIIVIGFGNGVHIRHIRMKYPNSILLILEPDNNFLSAICKYYDLSTILKDAGLFFINDYKNIRDYALSGLFTSIEAYIAPGYANVFNKEVQTLRDSISRIISSIRSDWSTQKDMSKQWYKNAIRNLFDYPNSHISFETDMSKSAIVAGAGPGLEKILEHSIEGSLLIATDTSVPYLIEHKIIPDIVISVDGRNISYLNFMREQKGPLYLFDIISPNVITRKISNKLFITSPFPFITFFLKKHQLMPVYDSAAGNVGTVAFYFAAMFGAERIHTFGMDFSYPRGDAYVRESYIFKHFHFNQSRLNTYLSQNWKLIGKYTLSYDCVTKSYLSPLLQQYSDNQNLFAQSLGYVESDVDPNVYSRNAISKKLFGDLSNSFAGVDPDDLIFLIESLKKITGKLHVPKDYFLLPVSEMELVQSVFPLMSHYGELDFESRIIAAVNTLEEYVLSIFESTEQ